METSPESVIPKSFSFRAWLFWFLSLLILPTLLGSFAGALPFGIVGFFQYAPYVSLVFIFPLGLIIGFIQFLYLRRKFRHSWSWVLLQPVVYSLAALGLSAVFINQLYTLSRLSPVFERLGSFALILLACLLPGAILHFFYLRGKHVPVPWRWFADYALVVGIGLIGFLFHQALTFEQPAPIPGVHGRLLTDMAIFILYTCAAVAWVMARVPFPGVPKKAKKGNSPQPVGGEEEFLTEVS